MNEPFKGKWDYQIIQYLKDNGPSTTYDIGIGIGAIDPRKKRKCSTGPLWRVMTRLELKGGVKQAGFDYSKKMNPILWKVSSNFECGENSDMKNPLFKSDLTKSGKRCYFNGVRVIHFYECGTRVCNCGGDDEKVWRQKTAEAQ